MIRISPRRFFPVLLCVVSLTLVFACNKKNARDFTIPEGPATQTLKVFATQAGIELLFDPQQVGSYRTQAVAGKFTPEQTLELMLKDTTLHFSVDSKTRAFAVFDPDPSASYQNLR